MDTVYYVVIPIVTSILGGLIAGLFTFLGVKTTLNHEKKIREEDLKIKQEEQRKQEIEKNISRNKKIIQTRPKLTSVQDENDIKVIEEFCILPYVNPKLINEQLILFRYPDKIFLKEYWDKYELILQNTGKREIINSFLHLPYESEVNIYRKTELVKWQYEAIRDYYSDERSLISYIHPNEKITIIVYYPKSAPELEDVGFDLYMRDEDDNYWFQHCVNSYNGECDSQITSPETFRMHLKQDCNMWFVYDSFYYSKDVKKLFNKRLDNLLAERKKANWDRTEEQDRFVYDVKNGNIALNYKLPLD